MKNKNSFLKRLFYVYSHWVKESPSTRNINLMIYQIKKHGTRKTISKKYYDDNFYYEHLHLEPAYKKIAEIIREQFSPKSVCDFGCGNGFLIKSLNETGIDVIGIDSSANILKYVSPLISNKILIKDLRHLQVDTQNYDITVSVEVAEHIHKKYSEVFLINLTRCARKTIIFSAAQPGQWGDGHINCQPKSYWVAIFKKYRWTIDERNTAKFTYSIKNSKEIVALLPWLLNNFMIFKREVQK